MNHCFIDHNFLIKMFILHTFVVLTLQHNDRYHLMASLSTTLLKRNALSIHCSQYDALDRQTSLGIARNLK